MRHHSNKDIDVQQELALQFDQFESPSNHTVATDTDISRLSAQHIHELLLECQLNHEDLERQYQELEQAKQELSVSHDDFAWLFNLSPVSYVSLNLQGVIQKANFAAATLIGCAVDDLVGAQFEQFVHPDDRENSRFFINQCAVNYSTRTQVIKLDQPGNVAIFSSCQGFLVCHCLSKDCAYTSPSMHVECQGVINKDQICLAIHDVTERKYAQETAACLNQKLTETVRKQAVDLVVSNQTLIQKVVDLNHSKQQILEREEKLQCIFNAAMEGIITIDDIGNIASVNAAVHAIFGYTEQELIGCHITKLLPESRKQSPKKTPHYLQKQPPKFIASVREVDGLRKDGKKLPLELSVAEFSIDGVSYITGIVRDVSLRKLQERYHKEHLEELAHVTRLGLMGEMASGIAHEVNQPLTAVASYTQACLNFIDAETVDLQKLSDILRKTNQQAIKAGQIIHRMRDFVKTRTLQRVNVDINNLIVDSMTMCAAELKQSNIIHRLELAKNLPVVYIDDVQIEQVLLNLIRNSIDSLKNLPEKTPRQLCIQTHIDPAKFIEVRVKDNGPGISQTEQEKILTPFYSTKSSGMGMGLSITRSLVEAHDGALRFN
ncbi:MAG: PAS domain S-box protein, partial [Methylococcales bacterium]|nr:PAS domain S-box protein [Methylococcales bacterium]